MRDVAKVTFLFFAKKGLGLVAGPIQVKSIWGVKIYIAGR